MLPLPLPLVSPEGLIVPNSMKLDSDGRMISPLLSALQHLPLATLPALTSASLLGALANQQRAGTTSASQPTISTEAKTEAGKSKVRHAFWLIWFINQRAYTIMLCPSLLGSVSFSVYSPPSHMVRHRNFIFGKYVHTSLVYEHQIFSDSDL